MEPTTTQLAKVPSPIYRWSVLIFVSLAMFGNYYIYDSIAPIFDLLSTHCYKAAIQAGSSAVISPFNSCNI